MNQLLKFVMVFALIAGSLVAVNAQSSKTIHLPDYDSQRYHFGILIGSNVLHYDMTFKEEVLNHWCDNVSLVTNDAFPSSYPSQLYDYKSFRICGIESYWTPGIYFGFVANMRLSKHLSMRAIPYFEFNV